MSSGDSYTIKDVLYFLSKVDEGNLHLTKHFIIRANERKSDIYPDTNESVSILLNEIPCGILKQSEDKFILIYNLNSDDDFAFIISIKSFDPIRINIVTCFPDEAKKRRREDAEGD